MPAPAWPESKATAVAALRRSAGRTSLAFQRPLFPPTASLHDDDPQATSCNPGAEPQRFKSFAGSFTLTHLRQKGYNCACGEEHKQRERTSIRSPSRGKEGCQQREGDPKASEPRESEQNEDYSKSYQRRKDHQPGTGVFHTRNNAWDSVGCRAKPGRGMERGRTTKFFG